MLLARIWLPRLGRIQKGLGRGLLYLIVVSLCMVFSFPFFWAVSSSLKTVSEFHSFPPVWFPKTPQWANYREVFTLVRYPFGRWIFNTVFITSMATFGEVLSASVVAYSFARFRYRGRELFFLITLSTMMIPGQVTLIPRYILFHKLHWIDTSRPLWVPSWFGGGAFNIFLLRQFFMTIPRDLDDAAKIDGANPFRIFWQLLMPLSKPVLATVTLIALMGHWNDFFGPLVYMHTTKRYTIALGLRFFSDIGGLASMKPLEHLLLAATTMSILPCILIFFAGQRYFVQGIVLTGIKG